MGYSFLPPPLLIKKRGNCWFPATRSAELQTTDVKESWAQVCTDGVGIPLSWEPQLLHLRHLQGGGICLWQVEGLLTRRGLGLGGEKRWLVIEWESLVS